MNDDDFDALFDQFEQNIFRLETLQRYAVDEEAEDFRAFREGRPRPVYSVRTSSYLARLAAGTAAGKSWQRVHIVTHPLSDYLHYELTGYLASQAAGEEIWITDRAADPALTPLTGDFLLLDDGTPHARAVLMQYDTAGHWLGARAASTPQVLATCRAQRDLAMRHAMPLNAYLAGTRTPEIGAT
jgi:hypothetical protein